MDHAGALVVGLGQTDDGRRELDWAAGEAESLNRPLHLVRAYHEIEAAVPWESPTDRSINAELRAAAQHRVDAAIGYLAESWPRLAVQGSAVDGHPAKVLCDASASAELTVVGSRQLGRLGSVVLGSVGSAVAAAAFGPVVVVRSVPGDPGESPEVIVGIDGSDATGDVLDFGFKYASRHGRVMRVVYCWPREGYPGSTWFGAPQAPERAERWLAEAVAGRSADFPDVTVRRVAVRDHAVDRLVAESHSQELLVVGAHGRHPLIATLLGSVTQGVLHHATCPVAVVRPTPG
jgi:nucleotide-binding universal stress UspA family protein